MVSRIDQIQVYEVVNVLTDAPLDHIDWMGFGKEKDEFPSEPTILGLGVPFFAQSMHMIADGLGVRIDEVTAGVDGRRRDRGHSRTSWDRSHAALSPHSITSGQPGSTADR